MNTDDINVLCMLNKPSIRSTAIPLTLAVIALIVLNIGLYTRLAPPASAAAPAFSLPFSADYAHDNNSKYTIWGGDWAVKDQTLVQMSTTGYDLGTVIPLRIPAGQPYQVSAKLRFLGGSMGGGLLFNVQQDTSRQKSQMVRFNVDGGKLYLIYGYFGDDSNFVGEGSVQLNLDPNNGDWHTLSVLVGDKTYALQLDDQTVAAGIPVQYQGGAFGLDVSTSQVAFNNVSAKSIDASAIPSSTNPPAITSVATQAPAAPINTGNFAQAFSDNFAAAGGTNPNWIPFAGKWQYEPNAFVQTDASGFDFGAGSAASYNVPLRLSVTFTQRQGVGGGVLFNMPQADSKNGAYMVRYMDPNQLVWGSFDASGTFNGQGNQQVAAPGMGAHTLVITIGANSYDIVLDGTAIASGIALSSSGGHIGLTASQSVVAFSSVEVETASAAGTQEATAEATAAATAQASTNVTLDTISGTWMSAGSVFTQTDNVQSDAIAGVGISAGKFSVSVDITLPDGVADAGGGLVFHMKEHNDPADGAMVRFSSDGQQIFWGTYDDQAVFQGAGSSPLKLTAGQPHRLTLNVRASNYDILVDGQAVVTGVPLTSTSGWIGLVGFRGPVRFTNFELTLSAG